MTYKIILAIILIMMLTISSVSAKKIIAENNTTKYRKIAVAGTRLLTECSGWGVAFRTSGTSKTTCKELCVDWVEFEDGGFHIFEERECVHDEIKSLDF